VICPKVSTLSILEYTSDQSRRPSAGLFVEGPTLELRVAYFGQYPKLDVVGHLTDARPKHIFLHRTGTIARLPRDLIGLDHSRGEVRCPAEKQNSNVRESSPMFVSA
jgi:hypothetical protein